MKKSIYRESNTLRSTLDFCIAVNQEKIENNGEDSYMFSIEETSAIACVFDGCGGSGAKRYDKLGGKTGAYIAARAVAGATKEWFCENAYNSKSLLTADGLKDKITECLAVCDEAGGEKTKIKGMLSKEFPTTLAAVICEKTQNEIEILCVWAGDSRCYLLDRSGLMQLSEDDIDGFDAMENLSADGILTNVISYSKDFELHTKRIVVNEPCVVFTATDGCFGYLSTPMEFEYCLLELLDKSDSARDWENKIVDFLETVSGDDFSLCGYVIGFGSFENLKNMFTHRLEFLLDTYIQGIEEKSIDEKVTLWSHYKGQYEKYLN